MNFMSNLYNCNPHFRTAPSTKHFKQVLIAPVQLLLLFIFPSPFVFVFICQSTDSNIFLYIYLFRQKKIIERICKSLARLRLVCLFTLDKLYANRINLIYLPVKVCLFDILTFVSSLPNRSILCFVLTGTDRLLTNLVLC